MPNASPPAVHSRSDAEVLDGLADGDPLALAEACARTLTAAAAVIRRLLPAADLEPTLEAAFRALWADPPERHHALEGWVRARCFALGLERLRERGHGPVAPSVRAAAPQLPAVEPGYLDEAERALAALDDEARRALVSAHDAGLPSRAQDEPGAGSALVRGLLALAGADQVEVPDDLDPRIADLVLGLLDAEEATDVRARLGDLEHDPVAPLVRALRRGRRRLEGLPPPAVVGLRLVARLAAEGRSQRWPLPAAPTPPSDEHRDESEAASAPPAAGAAEGPPAAEPTAAPADPTAAPADPTAAPAEPTAAPAEPPAAPAEPPAASGPPQATLPTQVTPAPGAAEQGEDAGARPRRSRGRRLAAFVGGLLLVAVGVALGLFVVGPLLVDWLGALFN